MEFQKSKKVKEGGNSEILTTENNKIDLTDSDTFFRTTSSSGSSS